MQPSAVATGLAEWATRVPDRIGVVDAQRAMTLGELDAVAGALAARLLDDGARETGAPTWLPIVVDRSVSACAAVHGVVRAGCAFARIESTTPRELVAELLTRLGSPTRAIVADPKYRELLPHDVDAISTFGHDHVGTAPPQAVDPDAHGRVQFTSGSTGRPKGVVTVWSGFDALVRSVTSVAPISHGDHWSAAFVHQFGAGAILRGIPLPSAGQTLCIADSTALSIDELLDWLDRHRVDSLSLPPSMSRAIVRSADGRRRLPSVSLLRSTSEPADWSLVPALRRLTGPDVTFRAGYSCSEAGGIAHLDIGPDDPIGEGRIPLGRLEPGVEVRLEVVDDDPDTTRLVVARPRAAEYLGDPELTASRLFTDEHGTRWWRSDDIVRVDGDGVFHFVGRANEMVKVKGSFVAPSRVEQALQGIDGIGAAAAILHRTENDSVRVVAHVQVDDESLTPERVDDELRSRLPVELLPAIVMRHEALPLTPRLKLDRQALEREPLVRWRSTPARAFNSEFEWWCLAEVRRIIGLDDVGPDDDLFDAGLDSLGALELGALLADAGFGDFDPPRLVEARTVAGIERLLDQPRVSGDSTVVLLNADGNQPLLFALPGGGGNALEYRFLAEALGRDQPIAVVEPRGMHRPGPPDRTVDARATHVCDEVDARLGANDACMLLAFSGGGPTAYEAAQRLHARGRHVHVVLFDSAPSTRGRSRPAELDLDDAPDAALPPTLRTASIRELPGAALRSAQFHWKQLQFRRLLRDPGPPSFEHERYRALKHIHSRANGAYEPAPAAFAVTLVQVEGSDARQRCGDLVANLVVHDVAGEHKTMLLPPQVEVLAPIVADAASECFSPTSASRSI